MDLTEAIGNALAQQLCDSWNAENASSLRELATPDEFMNEANALLDVIRRMARLDGPGRVVLHFRDDRTVTVEGQAIATGEHVTLFPTRYQIVPTHNIRELDTDNNDNDSDFDV